ncbi:MAG: PilW family protein [Candidatus Competibacteraceae bacterium]|nr:PilW family protein [Candidatus Competibacteraceae bacterium]
MKLFSSDPPGQDGFSLIELMIAMVLGLFILGSLLSLFVGNKQAYRVQGAASNLQENARFALEILNREARKAGYRAPFAQASVAFPAVGGSFGAGQAVSGTDTTLTLRYQGSGSGAGDGWIKDCLGRDVAEGDLATVNLFVNDLNELSCTADNPTDGPQTRGFINGVQEMRFTYGEDTGGDAYADAYVVAGAVVDWTRVVSVRIELLLMTLDDGYVDPPVPYTWNGVQITPEDRRMRRVYSNVIGFRNLLP